MDLEWLKAEISANIISKERTKKILEYFMWQFARTADRNLVQPDTKKLLEVFRWDDARIRDIEWSHAVFTETLWAEKISPESAEFLDAYSANTIHNYQGELKKRVALEAIISVWIPLAFALKRLLMRQTGKIVLKLGEKMLGKNMTILLSKWLPLAGFLIDAWCLYSIGRDLFKLRNIHNFTGVLERESGRPVDRVYADGSWSESLALLLSRDGINGGKSGADVETILRKVKKPFTLHITYKDGSPETTFTYEKGNLMHAKVYSSEEKKEYSIDADDMDIDINALRKPSPDWTIRACDVRRDDTKKFPDQNHLNTYYALICESLKTSQNWSQMDYSVDDFGVMTLTRIEVWKKYAVRIVPDPSRSDRWWLEVLSPWDTWAHLKETKWWLYQMIVMANLGNKLMALADIHTYSQFAMNGVRLVAQNDYGIIPHQTSILWQYGWFFSEDENSEWAQWMQKNMKTKKAPEGITKEAIIHMANEMLQLRKGKI